MQDRIHTSGSVKEPEQFIQGFVTKLRHHAFWDALLVFLPPLAAGLYCLFYLSREGWLSPAPAAALGFGALGVGALAIRWRYRPKIPSNSSAASLLDHRAGAQDRFLTLATLDPSTSSAGLVTRLRAEASALQSHIAIKREFPYRIKRSIYVSALMSLAAAIVLQLLLPLAHSTLYPPTGPERLLELARRMEGRPNLQAAALSLKDLAAKLEGSAIRPNERQKLLQDERKKITEQQKQQSQPEERQLLGEAASTLRGLEQQSGGGDERKQDRGGGGLQSHVPQEGGGEGQQQPGAGGDGQGERNAKLDDQLKQGQMSQQNPKDPGKGKSSGDRSGGGGEPDPSKSGKDQQQSKNGDGGKNEQPGRSKVSEEVPQGSPPAERFYKPGEGPNRGIRGAGYVTVQMPEEIPQDGKGGTPKSGAKGGKPPGTQVPVSNAPLPKHMPDAPAEKQQMPLEYRGIIR